MKFNGIILLTGKRGAGKSTIAGILSNKHGLKVLQSYTTRKPRFKNETGHIFVSDKEFDKISAQEMVAYSEHYGDKYCATIGQLNSNDIYIIDFDGVRVLKEKYKGDKPIYVVYLDVDSTERKTRMFVRGESTDNIYKYLDSDEHAKDDWESSVNKYADLVIDNYSIDKTIHIIEEHILKVTPKPSREVQRVQRAIHVYKNSEDLMARNIFYEEDLECIEEALKFYDRFKNIRRCNICL